jgi:hypothetical protein
LEQLKLNKEKLFLASRPNKLLIIGEVEGRCLAFFKKGRCLAAAFPWQRRDTQ